MQRRKGSLVFGLAVGALVAFLSYRWITDPDYGAERRLQERVVETSREIIREQLQLTTPQIVDPLEPNRKVGKVYIYPLEGGWEISGFYRRQDGDEWIPYLVQLDSGLSLQLLRVKDPRIRLPDDASDKIELIN